MHWDRLFEDLEGQLASEWEAERAALDAESERLRIARIELRSRVHALSVLQAIVVVESGRAVVSGRIQETGADWLAIATDTRATVLVPLMSVLGVRVDHGSLLASVEPPPTASPVRERMTLGFVLRDLARRRVPVTLEQTDGSRQHGTIDRAGADHLDLAVHDAGTPRRTGDVTAFRIIPFRSLACVTVVDPTR